MSNPGPGGFRSFASWLYRYALPRNTWLSRAALPVFQTLAPIIRQLRRSVEVNSC
jgi:hypothetical protein